MNPECLVIFQGPSHFISRKLYPSYKVFFVKFGAYCAASLIHSSILMLSAMFLPAMSNAVPWSTDVLKNGKPFVIRSEEHTSELQSRFDLVCRLLLEKKKLK